MTKVNFRRICEVLKGTVFRKARIDSINSCEFSKPSFFFLNFNDIVIQSWRFANIQHVSNVNH